MTCVAANKNFFSLNLLFAKFYCFWLLFARAVNVLGDMTRQNPPCLRETNLGWSILCVNNSRFCANALISTIFCHISRLQCLSAWVNLTVCSRTSSTVSRRERENFSSLLSLEKRELAPLIFAHHPNWADWTLCLDVHKHQLPIFMEADS